MVFAARLRQWHTYLGLFIAPSVLFFALTGALQIFSLHESHGSYRPPQLLEKLSAVHKDQVLEAHDHHAPPAADRASGPQATAANSHPVEDDDDKISTSTLALKWFFFGVSVCLIISTLIGIWMGTTQLRSKTTAWVLIIVGTLVPIVLIVI
jgi:hypothetical protein